MFLYNPDKDTFRTTSVWGKNGGDANAAKDLADVVTDSLNAILTAVDGEVVGGEYLHGNGHPLEWPSGFQKWRAQIPHLEARWRADREDLLC